MKKVNIKVAINDYKLDTEGYLNNSILSFNDKDELATNIIFDYNNNTLIRDNKEITIKLFFNKKENNIEYHLKEFNKKFYENLICDLLNIKDLNIIIDYQIKDTAYKCRLNIKEAIK